MNRLSMVIVLTLWLALPVSAQMYKWVDENGKVQYSDKPPPGNVKTEAMRKPATVSVIPAPSETKSAAKDAAKAAPKTAAEQELAFRKRQQEATKLEQEEVAKEASARARDENCKRAKAAVANLELGGRQVRMDEKGERVFLDEAQIAKETERARQVAAGACK